MKLRRAIRFGGAFQSTLLAVEKRLRQLGKDAGEASRTRVATLLRIGQLLGKGRPGRPEMLPDGNNKMLPDGNILTSSQRKRRHSARLLAEFEELVRGELATEKAVSLSRMVKICQRKRSARQIPMPERRYAILLVDPPWQYEDSAAGNAERRQHFAAASLWVHI